LPALVGINRVKGVTMKRIAVMVAALLGLALSTGNASASWGHLSYSGYQPWWNIFAKRYKCLTPEEERLQKFWHDYYDALRCFYKSLDKIDWVAYYKNHGYQINGGPGGVPGCGRINYAPVFVSPTLQWAVPGGAAPAGPPYGAGAGHPAGKGPGPDTAMGPHGPIGYPGASVPVGTGLPPGAIPIGPPYGAGAGYPVGKGPGPDTAMGPHGPIGYPGASVPVGTSLPPSPDGLPPGAIPIGPTNGAPISSGPAGGAPISSGPAGGAPISSAPITPPSTPN
jgi:hypothetical protein